jgi:hypothetical protein
VVGGARRRLERSGTAATHRCRRGIRAKQRVTAPDPGSGAAGHRQPLGLKGLMMLPAGMAHDLVDAARNHERIMLLARQRSQHVSVRPRHGGWPTCLSRETLGSNGSLRQVVVALEEFAPRKRPPPADPYLWLCTGTRESAGLKPSGRNLPAGGRGAGAARIERGFYSAKRIIQGYRTGRPALRSPGRWLGSEFNFLTRGVFFRTSGWALCTTPRPT